MESPPDWTLIVNDHGPGLWRTIYRLLNHHADACDCFQETFAEALQISRRERILNWPGLLRTVATRRALDRLRRRCRPSNRHESVENIPEQASPALGPAEQAELSDLNDRLREAVAQLPKAQAEIFCLRCFEEMSYREIAEAMRMEANAVGVLLHRARAQLSEQFKEVCNER